MPYIDRNAQGQVCGVYANAQRSGHECLPDDSEELVAFRAVQDTHIANAEVRGKLRDIDLSSIRSLREYVAAQTDAPVRLKEYDAEAVEERKKLE